jgi:hypothetical protein
LTNDVWRCLVSSPLASGDRLCAAPGWFASRYHAQNLSGTKQPYEVKPCRVPAPGPHRPFPFRGNVGRRASETSPCRRAGNAKRRARPPQGDGEQPGRRRGNRDPRALGVWPGCLPRRLQLVCTRSSGRNSLFRRCGNRCCRNRGRTPLGSMGGAPVTGLEANPTVGGVRPVPQRDHEGSKPQKKVSNNAVVVGCPSSACSSPGRAGVSSWLSPIGCLPL